jgi:murein DD-endopeptidase MepM/ murein hydrolase activator NlpD
VRLFRSSAWFVAWPEAAVIALALALGAIMLPAATWSAAAPHTAAASKKAAVATRKPATPAIPCGADASLHLSAISARQGGLLLAEVSAKTAATQIQVQGKWDGQPIAFWQESGGSGGSKAGSAAPSTGAAHAAGTAVKKMPPWRAFVAVDLEKAPGEYPLNVSVAPSSGEAVTCEATIHVAAGKFATENLHVDNQFVEPNAEQAARAKSEGERLHKIYVTVTPEKLWQGRFRIPLDGVTTGGNFGKRRVLNGQARSPHSGVDLPSPTGTPVHATQSGRVVLAEELFFAGNSVVLDHGLGIYTLYGHLSEIGVKAGDTVTEGEVIGKVGATGRVTGPHLHWGLEVGEARVNALQIVGLTGR